MKFPTPSASLWIAKIRAKQHPKQLAVHIYQYFIPMGAAWRLNLSVPTFQIVQPKYNLVRKLLHRLLWRLFFLRINHSESSTNVCTSRYIYYTYTNKNNTTNDLSNAPVVHYIANHPLLREHILGQGNVRLVAKIACVTSEGERWQDFHSTIVKGVFGLIQTRFGIQWVDCTTVCHDTVGGSYGIPA